MPVSSGRERSRRAGALSLAMLLLAAGCAAQKAAVEPGDIRLLAVLPIGRVPREPDAATDRAAPPEPLPDDAGVAVTGQIYRVLAHESTFRVVPDLEVTGALESREVRGATDLRARAAALGKAVGADAVLFGTVHRFRERVGTEFGATEPASVGFDLALLYMETGEVIWQGSFDRTQKPLTSDLFSFWMFWREGPRWFTARELAGLGVEKLLDEMESVAGG